MKKKKKSRKFDLNISHQNRALWPVPKRRDPGVVEPIDLCPATTEYRPCKSSLPSGEDKALEHHDSKLHAAIHQKRTEIL